LSESQDDSLTLGQPDSMTMVDDKNIDGINASEDLDESTTPLLGEDDVNVRNEVMN
jgi:hypothetical protein